MRIPRLDQPQRYQGLYVFDFGEWSAVGYTAHEVALLLESEQYRGGHVYKIHRALPDGTMELRGISGRAFEVESGLVFYRQEAGRAAADFETLRVLAGSDFPCRAKLQLLSFEAASPCGHSATALIYPAEYEDEVGRWLRDVDFAGGDIVEGGRSAVTELYQRGSKILRREQLWSSDGIVDRTREEIYASVRRAVQR